MFRKRDPYVSNIKIKKGLNLPILGRPEQSIHDAPEPKTVALVAEDYIGLKPQMHVQEGDRVKLGQVLFTDKQNQQISYTSPASGTVLKIHRGDKRALLSVVIAVSGTDEVLFEAFPEEAIQTLTKERITTLLLESGLWTALRVRPFSKVADPRDLPNTIFITAMDTNPLAPSMAPIFNNNERAFLVGVRSLSKLTRGVVFVCHSSNEQIPQEVIPGVLYKSFSGPHPAGLVGTHIHCLDPAGKKNHVWHIQAQDVIAIGTLLTSGRIDTSRVVSLGGPGVKWPRLLKTRLGANIDELTQNALVEGETRSISGSVLSGRRADGAQAYLGRYHQCISVIREDRKQDFLGWLSFGWKRFSWTRTVVSKLIIEKEFALGTSINGGIRAIVPIGSYEQVMPLDILPTFLLKALAVKDIDEAQKLGCLELDEEDLALCSFVCPSKIDHMSALRTTLNLIDKEG